MKAFQLVTDDDRKRLLFPGARADDAGEDRTRRDILDFSDFFRERAFGGSWITPLLEFTEVDTRTRRTLGLGDFTSAGFGS